MKLHMIVTQKLDATNSQNIVCSDPEGPGGVLPYKSDRATSRKILRTPLKVTRDLFYGRVPNSFPPLRGTNSTTTNYVTGTAYY